MKRSIFFAVMILLILMVAIYLNTPVDIRNEYLKSGNQKELEKQGQLLISKMEEGYGSRTNWDSLATVDFVMRADWYGRTRFSNWDTLPQLFRMTSFIHTNEIRLEYLNGKNKGSIYKAVNDSLYKRDNSWSKISNKKLWDKMVFKNYWFQFPFRIGEAQIIQYGGTEEINGEVFDLLYATWGTEKANREYDQFILYLNQDTNRIQYLHFTVRFKLNRLSVNCEFSKFKKIDNLWFPQSQYVRLGKPGKKGMRLHENHYEKIKLNFLQKK